MSLDITLYQGKETVECPHCWQKRERDVEVFSTNITHNLNKMADEAGIYYFLWRPDEIGATLAKHVTTPIKEGLERLKARPDYFKQFDTENEWGTYKDFIPWLEQLVIALDKNPEATIHISR